MSERIDLCGYCGYCGKMRRGRRRSCAEPCPESAVPGQLYETCGRYHFMCDSCAGHGRREPDAEEREAQRQAVEARAEYKMERARKREEQRAEAARVAEEQAILKVKVEELTKGLVCTDVHSYRIPRQQEIAVSGEDSRGWIRLYRVGDALVQIRERDGVTRAWGTPEQVEAWALAYAHEREITEAQAWAWRACYTGCSGQRMYDAILREAGHDPEALDPAQLEAECAAEEIRKAEERAARARKMEQQREARQLEAEERREAGRQAARVAARERKIGRLSKAQRRLFASLEEAGRPVGISARQRRTLDVLIRVGLAEDRGGLGVAL